jgi:hypothetical protein
MERTKLVDLIGGLWVLAGVLGLIFFFLMFFIFLGVSFLPDLAHTPRLILRFFAWGSWVLAAIFSLPQIITGLGLLRRQEWARILGIILSVFALFRFPLGTALGIFSLYVLTQRETTSLFR